MRDQVVEFLVAQDTSHLVTFAFNSDVSEQWARNAIKEWLKRVDSFALGARYEKKSTERTFLVAVPESIGINTHYHAFVRWPDSHTKKADKIVEFSQKVWNEKLVKSGNLDVIELYNRKGAAKYITKRIEQAVPSWLVSTEFHAV